MDGSGPETSDAVPVARTKRTSYENFVAECPWCRRESIFNRASDLQTFEPIGGRNVRCLNAECGRPIRIVGDSVNERHEMLIFDCYELLDHKHYMNCILNLVLAHETFFSLFLRVELLYKPFVSDPDGDLDHFNRLARQLSEKIRNHTFGGMRALFFRQILSGQTVQNLEQTALVIIALPDSPGDPKDSEIDSYSDRDLVPYLRKLKSTTIHVLRNRVVHKQAYRPKRDEVDIALQETRSVLFPLTQRLDLHDDLNWYMAHGSAQE